MNLKLYCPYCGRCLGECISSDEGSNCRTLIKQPSRMSNKHFIHNMKCMKCKQEIFILMEFKE